MSGREKSERKDSTPLMAPIQTEVARQCLFSSDLQVSESSSFLSFSALNPFSTSQLCSVIAPNNMDYTLHA